MSAYSLSGFALLLVAIMLWMIFSFLRRRTAAVVREIPAFVRLNRALGVSVEEGTNLHVSLGRGELLTPPGSASFTGLALLRKLVEETSGSDKPLIVTSGDGVVTIVSQDTLRAGYQAQGRFTIQPQADLPVFHLFPTQLGQFRHSPMNKYPRPLYLAILARK